MKITIEGLIGAGKSKLCEILEHAPCIDHVVKEPMQDWNISKGNARVNLLEKYYAEPTLYTFPFQVHCLRTRCRTDKQHKGTNTCTVFERGVESDAVFAKINYLNGNMDDTLWLCYLYQLEEAMEDTSTIDGHIYIKTSVNTCMQRIQSRGRSEEKGVTVEYMNQLETEHDTWLLKKGNVLIIDGEEDFFDKQVQRRLVEQVQAFIKTL